MYSRLAVGLPCKSRARCSRPPARRGPRSTAGILRSVGAALVARAVSAGWLARGPAFGVSMSHVGWQLLRHAALSRYAAARPIPRPSAVLQLGLLTIIFRRVFTGVTRRARAWFFCWVSCHVPCFSIPCHTTRPACRPLQPPPRFCGCTRFLFGASVKVSAGAAWRREQRRERVPRRRLLRGVWCAAVAIPGK